MTACYIEEYGMMPIVTSFRKIWISSKNGNKDGRWASRQTSARLFVSPTKRDPSDRATAWAPSTDKANDKIDMVERRVARFVTNDYGRTSSVTKMMANLGWDTLQKRRDLARLSLMYRIVHELVDIPVEPYLIPLTSLTRGHDSRFHQIRTSNTTYQYSFFPRTIILWKQLPQTAVSQTTLEVSRTSWPPSPSKSHALFLTVLTILN